VERERVDKEREKEREGEFMSGRECVRERYLRIAETVGKRSLWRERRRERECLCVRERECEREVPKNSRDSR